jgi:hypothetical protein
MFTQIEDASRLAVHYKPEPGMVGASLLRDSLGRCASKFPARGIAFISSEPIGLRRPYSAALRGTGKSATPARLVAGLTLTIRARLESWRDMSGM